MITATGLADIAGFIKNHVVSGRYTLNGSEQNISIYDTKLEGNVLKIFLLFDNAYSGELTNFKLIDTNGNVFDSEPDKIEKPDTKLLLVTFRYNISSELEAV